MEVKEMKHAVLISTILVSSFVFVAFHLSKPLPSAILHRSSQQESRLTLKQVRDLIINETPSDAIVKEIRSRGIDFPINEKILNELKELGAKPKIIQTLQESVASNPVREEVLKSEFPYMFKIPTVDSAGNVTYQMASTSRNYFVEDLGDGIKLIMVEIPGGEFLMGTTKDELPKLNEEYTRWYTEKKDLKEARESIKSQLPDHRVTIPTFYLAIFETTQGQWRQIARLSQGTLNENPSEFGDQANHPVENVSWKEAVSFCELLSQKTKHNYRLPTEAEWEYACRATAKGHYQFGFGDNITPELVNYSSMYPWGKVPEEDPKGETTPVGSYRVANMFGLFDMHGNVGEWVQDQSHPNYKGAPKDGTAWITGGEPRFRMVRGAAWYNYAYSCRCADRLIKKAGFKEEGAIGFRVALSRL